MKKRLKLEIKQDNIRLSVNSTNAGEGNEVIKASFNASDLSISFNSKYLIDIASVIEDKNIEIIT